jgi:hypothetical protein
MIFSKEHDLLKSLVLAISAFNRKDVAQANKNLAEVLYLLNKATEELPEGKTLELKKLLNRILKLINKKDYYSVSEILENEISIIFEIQDSLRKAVLVNSNEDDFLNQTFNLITQEIQNKNYTEVITLINSILYIDKNNTKLLYLKGIAYYNLFEYEKSICILFQFLKEDSTEAQVYKDISKILGVKKNKLLNIWIDDLFVFLDRNIQLFYQDQSLLPSILDALHFYEIGIDDFKILVYSKLVSPLLKSSAKKILPELALYLEGIIYNSYLYQNDSEVFFKKNVQMWSVDIEKMGETIGNKIPLPTKVTKQNIDKKILISFFFHHESLLAHIISITNIVKNYNQSEFNDFKFKAYFLSGYNDEMRLYFQNLNIEIFNIGEKYKNLNTFSSLLKLREHVNIDNTQILIWGCHSSYMAFTFGMRIAPIQTWFSVKYTGIILNSIDHYLKFSLTGNKQVIDGVSWRNFRFGGFDFNSSNLEYSQGELIRKNYSQHSILLATFGRESIIRDPPFLKALVEILKNNPQCGYLWTGKQQQPDLFIQKYFEDNGVDKHTHYIGWVNINVYSTVIDVFLDPFTFLAGHTLLSSMACGKASITYQSPSNVNQSISHHNGIVELSKNKTDPCYKKALKIVNESSMLFIAYSYDEYISKANILINDSDQRNKCASSNKEIVDYFYHRNINAIDSINKIFSSIINGTFND